MSNLFSKQSPWSHLVAAGTFALLFTACGDEVTEVTEVNQVVGMQVVEAGDALPKCTADNEGAMVYSVDSAAAYACIGKKWTSMKGKDGADGKDGKDGADGKNGKDGKNGTSESSSCTAKALKNGKGYKIVCGGDSVGVVLNGEDGQDGAKGDTGVAGTSCSAKEVSDGVKITCTDGKSFTLSNGADGISCSAKDVPDGVEITCTDGKSFTLSNGADGKDGESFVDGVLIDPRDKQIYKIVTIGEQTWMAENLNYADSVKTPSLLERSWCFNNDLDNCTQYGRLYTWAAAIDSVKLYKDKDLDCGYKETCSQPDTVYGICPPGWHLPNYREWDKLITTVGAAGKMLKSLTGWNSYGNGEDAYGFSALPAGYRTDNGNFNGEGSDALFWTATGSDSYGSYSLDLSFNYEEAYLSYSRKNAAASVRCIKD